MNQLSLRKILYTALAVGGIGVVTAGRSHRALP